MSTKIYNGYRINTGNIRAIVDLLDTVQKAYAIAAKKRRIDTLAVCIIPLLHAKQPNVLQAARNLIDDQARAIKKSGLRNPQFDFELAITIFPGPYDYTPALVFCEHKDLSESFTGSRLVEEWFYWDNTDLPEGVTLRDWNNRGKVWDKVLGHDTPAIRGLTRDYTDMFIVVSVAEVVERLAMPDMREHRAHFAAQDAAAIAYLAKHDPLDAGGCSAHLKKIKATIDKKAARILAKLKDPTVKDLLKG